MDNNKVKEIVRTARKTAKNARRTSAKYITGDVVKSDTTTNKEENSPSEEETKEKE